MGFTLGLVEPWGLALGPPARGDGGGVLVVGVAVGGMIFGFHSLEEHAVGLVAVVTVRHPWGHAEALGQHPL